MAALQIRSLTPEMHEWLSAVAEKEHRSVNQQALVMLKRIKERGGMQWEDAFESQENRTRLFPNSADRTSEQIEQNKARRRAALESIRELNERTGYRYPEDLPTPAEMIREDRDR
jgi:hypothetical protein